ncbi:hypothetical protein G6M89_19590 [Natronolimnobius sp. AArcel1]|nr:hypothetical protein [Natronolimnobius sp. AArcel1]
MALLERARTESGVHAGALCLCVSIGLVLAWVHWLGLVAGGAAVGLVSPTRTRAILGGVAFGLLALGAFALTLGETTRVVLEMTPVVYATGASAVGLAVLGSLSRVVL